MLQYPETAVCESNQCVDQGKKNKTKTGRIKIEKKIGTNDTFACKSYLMKHSLLRLCMHVLHSDLNEIEALFSFLLPAVLCIMMTLCPP